MPGDRERYEAMLLVAIREYELLRSEAATKIRDLKNRLQVSRSEQLNMGGTAVRISKEALRRAERRFQMIKNEQLQTARRRKRAV